MNVEMKKKSFLLVCSLISSSHNESLTVCKDWSIFKVQQQKTFSYISFRTPLFCFYLQTCNRHQSCAASGCIEQHILMFCIYPKKLKRCYLYVVNISLVVALTNFRQNASVSFQTRLSFWRQKKEQLKPREYKEVTHELEGRLPWN